MTQTNQTIRKSNTASCANSHANQSKLSRCQRTFFSTKWRVKHFSSFSPHFWQKIKTRNKKIKWKPRLSLESRISRQDWTSRICQTSENVYCKCTNYIPKWLFQQCFATKILTNCVEQHYFKQNGHKSKQKSEYRKNQQRSIQYLEVFKHTMFAQSNAATSQCNSIDFCWRLFVNWIKPGDLLLSNWKQWLFISEN